MVRVVYVTFRQVTTSVEEYRLAICLCGTSLCRQSFLDFVASDSTQQLLNRWHSPADRFAMLFDASVSQVNDTHVYLTTCNRCTWACGHCQKCVEGILICQMYLIVFSQSVHICVFIR